MIRPFGPADEPAAVGLLDVELGGRWQARLGEVQDVLSLPGFVAEVRRELVGVATYSMTAERAELAAIAVRSDHRLLGLGSALIDAVVSAVKDEGAVELWLVTTNDNLDALGLYQRRGFYLSEVRPGAVDISRRLKPSIPLIGQHGIPLRDELVLVRPLR